MQLDERNILNVLHKAEFADAHWFQLGQQLGLKRPALLNIGANRCDDPYLCMCDVISWWLNNDLSKSWEKLATAVENTDQYGLVNGNTVRKEAGIRGFDR